LPSHADGADYAQPIASPADSEADETMPRDYTRTAAFSPPLSWTNLPAATREIAVSRGIPTPATRRRSALGDLQDPGTAKGLPEDPIDLPPRCRPKSPGDSGVSGFRGDLRSRAAPGKRITITSSLALDAELGLNRGSRSGSTGRDRRHVIAR